jgi:cytidyltransferase-like protein
MRFKDFLIEKKEKHAVFAFGRMNPITNGHQKLVDTVKSIAQKVGGTAVIVLSHSQDSKKNPLTPSQKVKFAKAAFSGVTFKASNADSPNFLSQAASLYESGVTHLHMVGGSDRIAEFKKLLTKYNGDLFNFQKIEVHSAGERDPDADDVTGISASKMREFAANGKFTQFKKGAPSTMSKEMVKSMYDAVRKGIGIREDINTEFEELLTEGVHDKGIFKAVFLAGGPGSGKDYVLSNTLDGQGLVEINSDKALEFLMDKKGLDKRMPAAEKASRDQVRGRAKDITELRQKLALQGRNGLIINGTGDDVAKIARIKTALENLGYESSMLMVNTSDEVSAARNIERGQRGGRTVPETVRKEKWDAAQDARTEYAQMFGSNYMEFDNSEDLRSADPDTVKSKKMELTQLFKNVQDFIAKPPKNPKAEEWVATELEKKDTYKVPQDGVEQIPPSGDQGATEAQKLGLKYYGFGRYGINGKVTHRSIHGRLVPVRKEVKESIDDEFDDFLSEDLRKWFNPKHPEGGWKRINSKGEAIGPCAREPGEPKPKCMSNEKRAALSKKERASAVAAKRKHDPVADRGGKGGKPVNVSNFGKGKLSESFDLSDSSALNLLLLGTEIDEHDLPIGEEKEVKLLKDKAGRVRIFMLRAAAAREAHTSGGQVLKYKNGYVVQLKENHNVNEINSKVFRTWYESRRNEASAGWSNQSSNREVSAETRNYLCETTEEIKTQLSEFTDNRRSNTISEETSQETSTRKITLAEIRAKKEKLQEETLSEIDKGIEPGLSMAASGENMGRGTTKVKQIKKPLEELTGDETTASISAQVEDGLKKKGMDLKTFRAKRPIG